MRRLFRYQTLLSAFILIPVILISVLIIAAAAMTGIKASRSLADSLGTETSARVTGAISEFLRVPIHINEMNADAYNSGRIGADDASTWQSLLLSRVKYTPTVTSVYFGNTRGGLIDAGREGPGGELYVILTDGFSKGTFRKFGIDQGGRIEGQISAIPEFDARTRPWFAAAVEAGTATWTEPFRLFTGQDRAISAVRPVYSEDGSLVGVLSVDIFLSQLTFFLSDLQKDLGGFCFITDRAGALIAASNRAELPDELIEISLEKTRARAEAAPADPGLVSEELSLLGSRYHLHMRALPADIGLDWLVFSVYPDAVFTKNLQLNLPGLALGLIISLAFVALLSVYLAYLFGRPIHRLTEYAQAISEGRWPEPPGGSRLYETERLRSALIAMQASLKASFERLREEVAAENEAKQEVRALLQEKELMLKEVHHRMKNNLNVVISLLNLQEGAVEDQGAKTALREANERIKSMMLLYQKLFNSEDFLRSDASAYLKEIAAGLSSQYDPRRAIAVEWEAGPLVMPSRMLVLLGLVFNEILTNAYKYAFPTACGTIEIELAAIEGAVRLTVRDDGIGMPKEAGEAGRQGFGMLLITALVQQMEGTLEIGGAPGTEIRIVLPLRT